jgi:hypothetical protein
MSLEVVEMVDPSTGRYAIFREPVDTGAFDDPNSARNAPLNSPIDYLREIYFHSDFRYLSVAAAGSVTITHPSAGGGTNITLDDNGRKSANFSFGAYEASYDLVTHDLGIEPFAIVAVGNNIIWPGVPVQMVSGVGFRTITPFVTTSKLRITERVSSVSALAGISQTYSYLVINAPVGEVNDILEEWDPETGVFQCGFGKFRSDQRFLQVVPGGSPLAMFQGRSIDGRNGALRAIRADGTAYEPVPAGMQFGLVRLQMTPAYAGSMAYNGSYSGPEPIMVQAP